MEVLNNIFRYPLHESIAGNMTISTGDPNPACGTGTEMANETVEITFSSTSNLAQNQYLLTDSLLYIFVSGDNFDVDCDDYTDLTMGLSYTNYQNAALYLDGLLVQEYLDLTNIDPLSGLDVCGDQTPTVSPTVSPTFSVSPTKNTKLYAYCDSYKFSYTNSNIDYY